MRSKAIYSPVSLIITIALTSVGFFTQAIAQTQQQAKPQPPAPTASTGSGEVAGTSSILVSPDEDYRIGPRDVIEIKVDDAPELSIPSVSVNADGTFLMPYLKRMKAAGKTTDELAKEISDGLRGRYLKDPNVMVFVKQFNSHAFYVLGAVNKPGVYQIEGKPSLFELLTVAGGPTQNHGSTAFIFHAVKKGAATKPVTTTPAATGVQTPATTDAAATNESDGEYTVRTVNINGLFKGMGLNNAEAYLEAGDLINIPQSDVFFVSGEVYAPGQFQLSEGTTLRQAMALAQGTTFNAATGDGVIFRTDPATGHREEIKVDIGAVMKNRKPDVPLVANDVVLIPNSKTKTIGNALLKAMGMGAVQRGPFMR